MPNRSPMEKAREAAEPARLKGIRIVTVNSPPRAAYSWGFDDGVAAGWEARTREGEELPDDLRTLLADASVTIPRDSEVWALLGRWAAAKAPTLSAPTYAEVVAERNAALLRAEARTREVAEPTGEMVEAAARAIHHAEHPGVPWEQALHDKRQVAEIALHAALAKDYPKGGDAESEDTSDTMRGGEHGQHQSGPVRPDQEPEGAQLGGLDRASGPVVDRLRGRGPDADRSVPRQGPGDRSRAVSDLAAVDGRGDEASEAGLMMPPLWLAEAYRNMLRPDSTMLAALREERLRREAAQRQREREDPIAVKTRRWIRARHRHVRRHIREARETVALFIAPWLEPEDY